jgi:NMD protein affecting ribosome stability and mRNA decay
VLCLECGGESVDTDLENPLCSHCAASLYPLSTVKDTVADREDEEEEEDLFNISI